MALTSMAEEILVFDETDYTPTIGGYDFAFVDGFPPGHKCPICLLVMRNPVQTARCGHRFCESCFLATFRCESFYSKVEIKMQCLAM